MHEYGSIIGGRQVASSDWIEVWNPYSGALVGRVASADKSTTEQVVQRARSAKVYLQRFERHDLLDRMASKLEEQAADVSRLITDE